MLYVYVVSGSEDGVVDATTTQTQAFVRALDYIEISPNSALAADMVKAAKRQFRSLTRDEGLERGTLDFCGPNVGYSEPLSATIEFFAQGYS